MPSVPECLQCGTCCFSRLENYVRVSGDDYARLGERVDELVRFDGNRAYMRMVDGRCGALDVDPRSSQFSCTSYASRPQTCRDLVRGSGACLGELETKRLRPLLPGTRWSFRAHGVGRHRAKRGHGRGRPARGRWQQPASAAHGRGTDPGVHGARAPRTPALCQVGPCRVGCEKTPDLGGGRHHRHGGRQATTPQRLAADADFTRSLAPEHRRGYELSGACLKRSALTVPPPPPPFQPSPPPRPPSIRPIPAMPATAEAHPCPPSSLPSWPPEPCAGHRR
jgi:uncharacterized protein